jgi:glyoxylase I family protein
MPKPKELSEMVRDHPAPAEANHSFVAEFHGVRYQSADVARAVEFYTRQLGFNVDHLHLPDFGSVAMGALKILISGRSASGSRPVDGVPQSPGGWNRVVLRVEDLQTCIDELKKTGVKFRNEMVTGPGGKQVQVEDPDGNPIELFEPAQRTH